MSWLSRFAPVTDAVLATAQPQIEAWTDRSALEEMIVRDVTGVWPRAVGRDGAMRVPAVARARHLTVGTIASLPLYAMRVDERVTPQPYWCQGTDGQLGSVSAANRRKWRLVPQSPHQRMLWTVDDLLFWGVSLWLKTERLATGFPSRMTRVPFGWWTIGDDEQTVLDADGDPFPAADVVLIPGAHSGILDFGRDTIEQAAQLERTAADVARRPFRLELHQVTGTTLKRSERRELVAEAREALADNDGVLFTNAALETKDHALNSNELLIAGRNASALDVARHASMPAAMIDATTEGASLEYSTLQGRNQQWIDYGLSLYLDPIEARLGMDDIVPAGQRVAFDTSDLTALDASDTGSPTED